MGAVHIVKKKRMKRPPALILIVLVTTIILVPLLHRPFHQTTLVPTITPTSASQLLPECSFITPPSLNWSYNSRSFCKFSAVCIDQQSLYVPSQTPVCKATTAAFQAYHSPKPCSHQMFSRVTCAYTPGMLSGKPTCESPHQLSPHHHQQFLHHPKFQHVIVVPVYPFPANIYHFANVRTSLLHHMRYNTQKVSTILFLGFPNRNSWQASFHDIILSAITHMNPGITYQYIPREHSFCATHATLLGRRGHINVWPFPNTTQISPEATQLSLESIHFRNVFYRAFDISYRLPDDTHHQPPNNSVTLIPHPPLVLGYARRLGPGAVTGGNVHAIGTMRRFSETDETWFQHMLEQETRIRSVKLRVFTTSAQDSLRAQVSNFAGLGGVIGIHGANLVNAMFMPPLSLLIEVFPTNVTSLCYFAGGNAGLKYIRFESQHPASAEESGCKQERCLILARQRMVKIERDSERERLRQSVRDGLNYLIRLRKTFPEGIPVVKDPVGGTYNVVEHGATDQSTR